MRIFKASYNKLTLELCITGLKHYNFIWNDDLENEPLLFEREPDNPFDSDAIKVLLDNKMIGYISATDAETLAPIMDTNKELQPYRWMRMHDKSTCTDGYMIIQLRMKPMQME